MSTEQKEQAAKQKQTEIPQLRRPQRKFHGTCIWRIKEVVSPHQKEFRGYRFQVAVPNMNGHVPFKAIPAPSFGREYLILQSSDYNHDEVETKVLAHVRWLYNRGFSKVMNSDEYAAMMLEEMSKGQNIPHKERESN